MRERERAGARLEREYIMDLIADHISHRFDALHVLDKVSFTVTSGEVVAIVGPWQKHVAVDPWRPAAPERGPRRTARRAAGQQSQSFDLRVSGFRPAALVHGGSQCRVSARAYRARRHHAPRRYR